MLKYYHRGDFELHLFWLITLIVEPWVQSTIFPSTFFRDKLNQIIMKFVNFLDAKLIKNDKNKSCVMNTTAGYVIMFIQNDVMTCQDVI